MKKIKKVKYGTRFVKLFKKLPKTIKLLAIKKEKIFKEDVFDPILKTHKLDGELKGYYSFSVNYSYRIVFTFENGNVIVFTDIGDHSVYS